jgi:AraC-like DNA-binding protein
MHARRDHDAPSFKRDTSTSTGSMEAALIELRSSGDPNISSVARKHGVSRSTLSRRFRSKTSSSARGVESRRVLNNRQEDELINYIHHLCERCLPPTPKVVANIAQELCGRRLSKNWSSRFVARHKHRLDARYLNTIDLARHRADSRSNYEAYFAIIGQKLEDYKISADNIYNMDEKGFLIGRLQKARRVFARELYERGTLAGAGQDGSREWITVVATICADGTRLSPALIYKAISGNLQDTWLDDFEPDEHDCHFASSPKGWTSDELGYSWLTGLFEKETAPKARRSYRLLFVDGHGSHVNMKFLNWCEQHKVLLAVYPPHSTHRLQPLDVGIFAPLANYYSQALDDLVRKSEGHTSISKRDFFSLFWPAFEKAFTKDNILSAWSNTGISPFDPQKVLKSFPEAGEVRTRSQQSVERLSESLPSTYNSPSKTRRLRSMLNVGSARSDNKTQKTLERLSDAVLGLSAKLVLANLRVKHLSESLQDEEGRKKRRRKVVDELRVSGPSETLFMSPTKIQKTRDILTSREVEKRQLQDEKRLRAQARAQEKARKEAEAQRKRDERTAATFARKTAEAQKKAVSEAAREARKVQKQFGVRPRAIKRQSRSVPKGKSAAQTPVDTLPEGIVAKPVQQAMTASGRPVRRPARFDK